MCSFSPWVILFLFTACNFLNYVDRGVLGGQLHDMKKDPAFGLRDDTRAGILQGCFTGGFMIAAPIFAQLAHTYRPTRLMMVGMMVWVLSAYFSGLAPEYFTLALARTLIGVGEASFAGLAPAFIDEVAVPAQRTIWLAIFFTAIPVGQACGYILSGNVAKYWGWRGTFLIEATCMIPFCALLFFVPRQTGRPVVTEIDRGPNSIPPSKSNELETEAPSLVGDSEFGPESELFSDELGGPSPSRSATTGAGGGDAVNGTLVSPSAIPAGFNPQVPVITDDEDGIDGGLVNDTAGVPSVYSPSKGPLPAGAPRKATAAGANAKLLEGDAQASPGLGRTIVILATNPIYVLIVLGYTAFTGVIGCLSLFVPDYLSQSLKAPSNTISTYFGLVTVAAGVLGTSFGGLVVDRARKPTPELRTQFALGFITVCTMLGVPIAAMAFIFGDKSEALVFTLLFVGELLIFAPTAPLNGIILSVVPNQLRSSAMAFSIFCIHAFGDLPTPILIGRLIRAFRPNGDLEDPTNTRWILCGLCGFLIINAILWGIAHRAYKRRQMEKRLFQYVEDDLIGPSVGRGTDGRSSLDDDEFDQYGGFDHQSPSSPSPPPRSNLELKSTV